MDTEVSILRATIHALRIRNGGKLRKLTVNERIYLRGIAPYWWFRKPYCLPGLVCRWQWR